MPGSGLEKQLGAATAILGYNPTLAGAAGTPITGWDCTSAAGTKILPKYLPASCR